MLTKTSFCSFDNCFPQMLCHLSYWYYWKMTKSWLAEGALRLSCWLWKVLKIKRYQKCFRHSDRFQNFSGTSNNLWRFPIEYSIYDLSSKLTEGGKEQGEGKGTEEHETVISCWAPKSLTNISSARKMALGWEYRKRSWDTWIPHSVLVFWATYFLYDIYWHFCNIHHSSSYFSQGTLYSTLSAYQVEDFTEVQIIIFLIA